MRRAILITLVATMGLSACGFGSSRLNPFNWFGGPSRSERVTRTVAAPAEPVAQQITQLRAAPTPGGVIVSAVALPPTQGFYDAELVRIPSNDAGTALFEFRLKPPATREPVGAPQTREVLTGAFLSTADLAGIRAIAVQGSENRRTIRRQ